MTLQHGNRVRKIGGKRVVRELHAAETTEVTDGIPDEDAIRDLAYEIYLSRNGTPGNAELDWLQAETELRAPRYSEGRE